MVSPKQVVRAGGLAIAMALGVGCASTPASAQGFFDQLFGLSSPPVASPVAPTMNAPDGFPAPQRHRRKVAVDQRPVRQQTTDLMHDKTLRVGDAVMMKDGIHVYLGPETNRHTSKQFLPLDDAYEMSSNEREKLASLDVTRPLPVIENRSASDVVTGFKITDARGNSVRYVGP